MESVVVLLVYIIPFLLLLGVLGVLADHLPDRYFIEKRHSNNVSTIKRRHKVNHKIA